MKNSSAFLLIATIVVNVFHLIVVAESASPMVDRQSKKATMSNNKRRSSRPTGAYIGNSDEPSATMLNDESSLVPSMMPSYDNDFILKTKIPSNETLPIKTREPTVDLSLEEASSSVPSSMPSYGTERPSLSPPVPNETFSMLPTSKPSLHPSIQQMTDKSSTLPTATPVKVVISYLPTIQTNAPSITASSQRPTLVDSSVMSSQNPTTKPSSPTPPPISIIGGKAVTHQTTSIDQAIQEPQGQNNKLPVSNTGRFFIALGIGGVGAFIVLVSLVALRKIHQKTTKYEKDDSIISLSIGSSHEFLQSFDTEDQQISLSDIETPSSINWRTLHCKNDHRSSPMSYISHLLEE